MSLAPSTADFSSYLAAEPVYLGDCTHRLAGYVDAQNAFGAQLRKYYIITVKHIDGIHYRLIDLKM